MGSHLGRGILAVFAAIVVTLVVFRASAAEVPAASETDEIQDESSEVISAYSSGVGERLVAGAERQVTILGKLPTDIASGLFVDLPRKSRAFEAAANVKDPRTVAIALTADFDALGAQVSGIVRGAEGRANAIEDTARDLLGRLQPGQITTGMGTSRFPA